MSFFWQTASRINRRAIFVFKKSFAVKMFRFFRKKSLKLDEISPDAPVRNLGTSDVDSIIDILRDMVMFSISRNITYGGIDGMEAFVNYGEVFFPIHFIASRIAGAHFEIKKVANDAIVWCTTRSKAAGKISKILTKPNAIQSWYDFVYLHIVSKLACGNAFDYAAIPEIYPDSKPIWEKLDQLWCIPGSMISINTAVSGKLRIFGFDDLEETIKGYRISGDNRIIPPAYIWHDKDLCTNFTQFNKSGVLMSPSRLDAVRRNIANLSKVYDARGTIYENCGALGIITNETKDDAGPVAMSPEEKDELYKNYNSSHGIVKGKSPIMISNRALRYQNIGLSIAHLQPFEETLADAVEIAGIFEIPSVLIPRKDQSTFDNQANAEKAVYSNVIKRIGQQFCKDLTTFLQTEDSGYYIDINFNDVDCLQVGRKESEECDEIVNRNSRQKFIDGMISYNIWRGNVHEQALDGEIYDKTRMEMTDEEIAFFNARLNNIFGNTSNPQREKENGTDDEKPSGDNEG